MAEHWCKEHRVAFFKKGQMRGFAHPIKDDGGEPTGEWCNEEEAETSTPKEAATPPPEKSQMTPAEWTVKDKLTRKSIERQTALNAAVKVSELTGEKDKLTEKIISTARRFELYLETGIDVVSPIAK